MQSFENITFQGTRLKSDRPIFSSGVEFFVCQVQSSGTVGVRVEARGWAVERNGRPPTTSGTLGGKNCSVVFLYNRFNIYG